MNITKVSYSRKFSLPNYENLDLSIEAQLNEKDNPLEVWSILADNAEMWFIASKNKTVKTAESEGKPQTTPSPFPKPSTSPPPTSKEAETEARINNIKMQFPQELETRLNFELKNESIIVSPKQFLGSETFAKVSGVIRGLGGEYISAGKNSHWRVKA